MAKKQIFSAATLPNKFQSIDELHRLGYALEHERKEPVLEQPWVEIAKQARISQSELARRCGLTRQSISNAASKGTKLDIVSALLLCDTLGITVEKGFRLTGGQCRYTACRRYDENLFVNLRTLEVVLSSKKEENENYEKLYYIYKKKGVCTGGP